MAAGQEDTTLAFLDLFEVFGEIPDGSGPIFRARKIGTPSVDVVIRPLPSELSADPEAMASVRQSFARLSGLRHANIVSFLGLHQVDQVRPVSPLAQSVLKIASGDCLAVTEYAPGVTLSEWRASFPGAVVPPDRALEAARQICGALDYAHRYNIFHLDLKPRNIMVEAGPGRRVTMRVMDFSPTPDEVGSDPDVHDPYMAPEIASGCSAPGAAADQYAVALLTTELLTGDLKPVVGPRLPAKTAKVLTRALAADPAARFPTIADFARALQSAEPRTTPLGAWLKRQPPRQAALLGVLAGVITAVCGDYIYQKVTEPRRAAEAAARARAATEEAVARREAIHVAAQKAAEERAAKKNAEEAKKAEAALAEAARVKAEKEAAEKAAAEARAALEKAAAEAERVLSERAAAEKAAKARADAARAALLREAAVRAVAEAKAAAEKAAAEAAAAEEKARREERMRAATARAREHFKKGEWAVALQAAQESGGTNAELQVWCGNCYLHGLGVERNPLTAVRWFQKAADAGDPSGQRSLGFCYDTGTGVGEDARKAAELFRAAMDGGDLLAKALYSQCLFLGSGVTRDEQAAYRLAREAGAAGNAFGQYMAGLCSETGKGAIQSRLSAKAWYEKAAAQGLDCARDRLEKMNFKGPR